MTPRRIQLSRRKGFKLPPNTVVVSRPSKWGNPHRVVGKVVVFGDTSQAQAEASARAYAVARFEFDLREGRLGFTADDVRNELGGRSLACWCPLPEPGQPDVCHAAILLRVANEPRDLQQGRGDG